MQSHNPSPESQFDPSRYEVLRTLGSGGAGTVFLARDRETGEQLALKQLQRIDHKSVLRFKREFRSLANVRHPSLIRLYDLGRAPDGWFLTMEYVAGRSLSEELATYHVASNDQGLDAAFVARVVDLFEQLASGVRAIHAAGMLHRDLKPSNVMVTPEGRVVVLDFGLVRDIAPHSDARVTQEGMVTGTPAYMSPEQTTAQTLNEASDWYAFGVMLYEALCGHLPIRGRNMAELLTRKVSDDPEPIDEDAGVPPPLAALCMQLLQRDTSARPSGTRIVEALSAFKPRPVLTVRTSSEELVPNTEVLAGAQTTLFGRDRELQQLRDAFTRTSESKTVVAHVRGTSGAGKSALVEGFLEDPELSGPYVLVLRSRCYEREAMPFKALDGVIDTLVADLLAHDAVRVAHLLPRGIGELAQLFPIFERLPVASRLLRNRPSTDDAEEARRRAERALKELIERLGTQRQLVIWIDDLQWGDLDSAELIARWLRELSAVPLLLIFSYRSEESTSSPCLRLLLEPPPAAVEHPDAITIELAPLNDTDVRELCSARSSMPPRWVDKIVEECQGNPFLAQQLIALALTKQAQSDAMLADLSIEQLVHRTVSLLEPEARELLRVLAIAGRPVAPGAALSAAGVLRDGRNHIHALQTLRLTRTRMVGGQRWIEVYHDRVREGVHAMLSEDERAQRHASLLSVLEHTQANDPDWLHELAMGAHDAVAAYRYGLLAAERARASLAFERAAELYARCLRLSQQPTAAAELWMKLGLALVRCRRGAEAADAYLHAAENVAVDQQPPLLRLAASHLLRSGRFEEGERLIARLLAALGLDVPRSDVGLMAAIGWERARVALLGITRKPQPPADDTEHYKRLAELYGTLSVETQMYAPLRAALFQARSLRLALRSGDPETMARTLCLAGALVCISGTQRATRRSQEMFARAQELAVLTDSDDVAVEIPSGRALSAIFLGRPLEAVEQSNAANRAYELKIAGGGHGDYFYWFAINAARLAALQALGHHRQARAEMADYLARAHATGNRAAVFQITLTRTLAERSEDNCAHSRARLDAERAELPESAFGILGLLQMISTMLTACSTGEHAWAMSTLEQDWPAYLRSPIHMTAYTAAVAHFAHARLLLNRHLASGAVGDARQLISADVRALRRLPQSTYRDVALARLRARCAYLRGDVAAAVAGLRESTRLLDAASFLDEPERDRFALGCLIGGAEGTQLKAAAVAALLALGAIVPLEELESYYPELFAAGLADT